MGIFRPSFSLGWRRSFGGGGAVAARAFRGLIGATTDQATGTLNFASLNPQDGDLVIVFTASEGGAVGNMAVTGYTRVTALDSTGGTHHRVIGAGVTSCAWTGGNGNSAIIAAVFGGTSFGSGAFDSCSALGGSNTATDQSPGSRTPVDGGYLAAMVAGLSGSAITGGTFSGTPLEELTIGRSGINIGVAVYAGAGVGIDAIHTHASTFAFGSSAGRRAGFALLT